MRRPFLALFGTIAVVLLTIGLIVLVTTPLLGVLKDDGVDGQVLVAAAARPVGIEALANGAILYGEQLTGAIRRVRFDGQLVGAPEATVSVLTDDSAGRGLLGVTSRPDGAIFASWTRAKDGRLVVGRVAPGKTMLIWVGPPSADEANGGQIALSPTGEIVVGVGAAGAEESVDDPDAPNGKLLALDPDLARDRQQPEVLSSGWHDPRFAYDEDGRLWVADNAPTGGDDRIGLGDVEDAVLTPLDGTELAPSALIALPAGVRGDLGVCGTREKEMRSVSIEGDAGIGADGVADLKGNVIVEPCSRGAAILPDGSIVFATESQIRVQRP